MIYCSAVAYIQQIGITQVNSAQVYYSGPGCANTDRPRITWSSSPITGA